MALIPSQSVNESTKTPISGIKAKARNINRAGTTRMPSRLLAPPAGGAGSCNSVPVPAGTSGARAVMSRLNGGGHRRRELLRRDLQQEQLIDVVQQSLGLLRAECLIPGLLEVGRLTRHVEHGLQERCIGRTGQLRLRRLDYRHLAALDVRVDLGIGEQAVGEIGLGNRLLLIGGL